MSSFKGRMRLYTNLCIDRFDGINLKCTAFFLSHCHKDHMVGLDDKKFETCLSSRQGVFLYCSEITRLLLLADDEYKPLQKFIKALEVGSTHSMKIPNDRVGRGGCEVAITLISAGHCPGSVMFLFEGDQGTCLYTGDFRWEPNYASTIAAFRTSDRLKEIDHLYIDTTFCVPAALHIPSRVECAEATLSLVAMWLERSPRHQVAFFCPARYGYEFLLREIATRLGFKIHVSATKYTLYEQIPDLCGLFTSDPKQARIHACCPKLRSNSSIFPPCLSRSGIKRQTDTEKQDAYQVLNIRPCAMWFTTKTGKAALKRLNPKSPRGLQRVCYSMHSSYSEIEDLVSYLQPHHVWPNVIPASDHGPKQVQERLNSFLEKLHPLRPKVASSVRAQPDTAVVKNFNLLDTQQPQKTSSLFRFVRNDSDSSDGCIFDSPDSVSGEIVEQETVVNRDKSKLDQSQPTDTDHLEQKECQVLCPDDDREEADSDLHLRLSQDSDSSDESQQIEDNPQSEKWHSCPISRPFERYQDNFSGSALPLESKDLQEISKHPKEPSEDETSLNSKKFVHKTHSESAGQTKPIPHCSTKKLSPKCHRNELKCGAEYANSPAGQVSHCDSRLSNEEEDEDVIDSSPQFKSKVFTSLLKGRPVKISPSIPCHDPTNPSSRSRSESHLATPVTVKRCILSSQQKDLISPSNDDNANRCVNTHETRAKKMKLSSGSEFDNCVVSSDCDDYILKKLKTSIDSDKLADKTVIDNEVCVIPSDSEETDEDSEKMLKPLGKAKFSASELLMKTKRSDFIDLTEDI